MNAAAIWPQALSEASAGQLADAQARLARAMERAHAAPDVAAADSVTETARAASRRRRATRLHEARPRATTPKPPNSPRASRWKTPSAKSIACPPKSKALGDLLHPEGEGLFPPLIDAVTVQSGYEAALAAAPGRRSAGAAGRSQRRIIGAIWARFDAAASAARRRQAAQRFCRGARRAWRAVCP